MLVISRKVGESVRVGSVRVMLTRIGPGIVRIGIAAPWSMPIARSEVDRKDGDPFEAAVVDLLAAVNGDTRPEVSSAVAAVRALLFERADHWKKTFGGVSESGGDND